LSSAIIDRPAAMIEFSSALAPLEVAVGQRCDVRRV